jgi:hypothetical protein
VKRTALLLSAATVLLILPHFAWAQDSGVPDTMYVEVYPSDQIPPGDPPYLVRFPIYVTHDIVDPRWDSLAGFVIPLRYWRTNPAKYCSLPPYWNNVAVYPHVGHERSIFRHIIEGSDTLIHNRMMDMAQALMGWEWDFRFLDASYDHYWLSLVPTGSPDRRWEEGSRVLLSLITFKLEDSMTICIDTGLWPPGGGLRWSNSAAQTFIPRHLLEICETVSPYGPAPSAECPESQYHQSNGQFSVTGCTAESYSRVIETVEAEASGDGLGSAWLENVVGLGTSNVQGDVVYEVTDHCTSGGGISVTAYDDVGRGISCSFSVYFWDNPPDVVVMPTWRALAGYTMHLGVSAVDPDGDPAVTWWNGIWHETDPGRRPVHYPSYQPGNPGELIWEITESDTGSWISSFSAVDICGLADTQEVSMAVGLPYCGDCTGEGELDVSDVISLLNYLFRGGDPPEPLCRGDANCNGERDAGDVVLLINFLFKSSFAPCFECCAE